MPDPSLGDRIGMAVMEPGSLVMERKMLRGIKERAERLARIRLAVALTAASLVTGGSCGTAKRTPSGICPAGTAGIRAAGIRSRSRTRCRERIRTSEG